MIERYLRHLRNYVASKLIKWLLIALIGYLTWVSVIGTQQKAEGTQLIEQGKQLYNESKSVSSHNIKP
ncbi:hypothetical protein HMPREF0971_01446 [Segatella oris F0302]|uniref:Uncharacterized protein n=1 Tax=Segatella oris F0302 TaxID=649760 RepID=D1QR43_9BACT|nr:hypothetical protein [Segatella oris]EFB32167.1 hypothetical protein HMPREF0971_01446 [Segatella oris F0302]